MGTTAARKARVILDNVQKVLGIEAFAASQAISFRGDVALGKGTAEAYKVVRKEVAPVDEDRIMYVDMNRFDRMIKSEAFVRAVESAVGELE